MKSNSHLRIPVLYEQVGPLILGDWMAAATRITLVVMWVWAGLSKVGDLFSAQRAAQNFQIRKLPGFGWLTWEMEGLFGALLPFLEISIALLLAVGLFTRFSATVSSALLIVFILGIASVWARGIPLDCGCFGGGGITTMEKTNYPLHLFQNAGYLLCGLWLVLWNRFPVSVDAWLEKRGTLS